MSNESHTGTQFPPDSILGSMRRLDRASCVWGVRWGSYGSNRSAGISPRGLWGPGRCKSLEMQETSLTLSSSKALGWKDAGLVIITAAQWVVADQALREELHTHPLSGMGLPAAHEVGIVIPFANEATLPVTGSQGRAADPGLKCQALCEFGQSATLFGRLSDP